MDSINSEVVIIGAGVTGLAAGIELQEKAVILEKEDTPGGIVRSFCFGGYWFDNVVHLLHFRNKDTLYRLLSLFGTGGRVFRPCPPVGYVETSVGTTRYPFQLNLNGLDNDTKIRCLDDFYETDMLPQKNIDSYKDFLLNTFGQTMCETFFFPYNNKLWKYPLEDMTSSGQTWNINKPTIEEVLDGAFDTVKENITYNSNGYYPRPPIDAPQRGMEILSQMMSNNVRNLHLNCNVIGINMQNRTIYTNRGEVNYEECFSTIPLPSLIDVCICVNPYIKEEVSQLKWNKVISMGLSIVGKRPKGTGHWRYFTDPAIPFTRIIYMTEFDEYAAPDNGYGLLIEIPQPSDKFVNQRDLLKGVLKALLRLDIINHTHYMTDYNTWEVNPAYVIFTKETEKTIEQCKGYLAKYGITLGGRYGNWEYSSMAENIEDGFNFGRRINK